MADDYTPTTEYVRSEFVDRVEHWELVWSEMEDEKLDAAAEFDRWLTEHNRQVAEVAWDRAMEDRDGFPGVSGLTNPYSKED